MAFDAGTIRTEADLDIAAFQRNMVALQAAVGQVNKTMEGVKPATVSVDTKTLDRSRDEVKSAVAEITKELGGLGELPSSVLSLAFAGGATAAVAASVAIVKALHEISEAYDDAIDRIRIGSGVTGEALGQLEEAFRDVATTVPDSFEKVGTVLSVLQQRIGNTGEELGALTETVLTLSRITKTDAAENARLAARAFGDWGVAAEDQIATLDLLFRASQQTGIGIDRLQQLLVQFGAPMRQLGFSLEETAAILGKFEKEGVNTELVMGSLRIALGALASRGLPAEETLRSMMQTIHDTADASKAAELGLALFGRRAGPDMVAAIREGRFELGNLVTNIKEGSDTIAGAAEATDGSAEKFRIAINKMSAALVPFGQAVEAAAVVLLDRLVPALEAVGSAEGLRGVNAAVAAFLPLVGAVEAVTAALGVLQAKREEALAAQGAQTPEAQAAAVRAAAIAAVTAALEAQGLTAEQVAHALADLGLAADKYATSATDAGEAGAEMGEQVGTGAKSAEEQLALLGKGVATLQDQLKAAGGDIPLIQSLLEAEKQTKDLDEAISSLTDTSIAAFLQAEKNMALAVGEATGDWSRWEAAVQGARRALEDQKAVEDSAKEAKQQANEELKKQQKIMQEVAAVAGDQYKKRLEELAKTLLPGLSAESAILVQQLLLQGEAYKAAQVAAAAYGKGVEDLGPIHDASQAQFEETKKKAEELAKAIDPAKLFRDELASRSKSLLGAVADNLDAASAAALRHQASVVGDAEAVSQKLQQMGVDAATFRAAMQAGLSGSAEDMKQFTAEAQNAVKFLQTGAIPQVPAPPKDAVEAWSDAYQKASQQLADAGEKTQDALRKADDTLQQETAAIALTLAQAQADFERAMAKLDDQDREARRAFDAAAGERAAKLSAVQSKLQAEATDALGTFFKTADDADKALAKSLDEMAKSSLESIQELHKQSIESTEQWAKAQEAAWTQLSASLTAIRQQETQANLAFSRSIQEITEKALIGPQTQEATNELAKARLRLQQDFALQEAGLSTAESAARGAFGRATTAADAQLKKAAEENAKALKKVLEELEKKRKEAEEKQQQAIQDADEKLRNKLEEIATKQAEATQKAAADAKKAAEDEEKRQQELAEKRKELERKQKEAEEKAEREQEKADKKHAQRVDEIKQDQAKEAEKFRKAMTEANKDMVRAMKALEKMGIEQNTLMKAFLKRAGVEVNIDYKDLVIQETGVDFLKVGIKAAETAMKAL